MPTNSELLISLRNGFEDLEVFDDSGLNALRDRGQMSIRRVFGENSSYGDDPPIYEFYYTGPFIIRLGAPASGLCAHLPAWRTSRRAPTEGASNLAGADACPERRVAPRLDDDQDTKDEHQPRQAHERGQERRRRE